MTQFHEGQEVEVAEIRGDPRPFRLWRKARIIRPSKTEPGKWLVELWNHDRGVFDAEHIRKTYLDFRENETHLEHIDRLISEGK